MRLGARIHSLPPPPVWPLYLCVGAKQGEPCALSVAQRIAPSLPKISWMLGTARELLLAAQLPLSAGVVADDPHLRPGICGRPWGSSQRLPAAGPMARPGFHLGKPIPYLIYIRSTNYGLRSSTKPKAAAPLGRYPPWTSVRKTRRRNAPF